tara:strand:+ start:41 stop:262 length:222 start_codon:yes stop_codon:yes gene_type:complete
MSRQLQGYGLNILKLHVQWLLDNGYKQQATSCKMQIRMILKKQQATSHKATSNKLQAIKIRAASIKRQAASTI